MKTVVEHFILPQT